jgi:signal transduction histidine kinase
MNDIIDIEKTFFALPDMVVITDIYYYIINYNRPGIWGGLKKGKNIKKFVQVGSDKREFTENGKSYYLTISPVTSGESQTGYIFYFTDITEKKRQLDDIRKKSDELAAANQKITESNRELSEFAERIREIADENEKIQIAKHIHDDAGHTLTILHSISQTCLTLLKKGGADAEYREYVGKGTQLCKESIGRHMHFDGYGAEIGLNETLSRFSASALFPVELKIIGEERGQSEKTSGNVLKICKEAYHNTLSHTLADHLNIGLEYKNDETILTIGDNGLCGDMFEKGFGLTKMEETAAEMGASIVFRHEAGRSFEITVRWRGRGEF